MPTATGPGPELLRRVLLGFVTALIVARPLVPGEDPGRTQLGTGVAGLGLVFLWLLAAAGWGVWRAWSRQGAWRGSLVEAGLLVLVGVSFFSADQPGRYWYPGWLISWEWVGVFVAFCLVRQLFRKEEENDGLLAAMLATGVALIASWSASAPKPDETLAKIFGIGEIGSPVMPAEPSAFLGLLVLLFPALYLAGIVVWRANAEWPRRYGIALCIPIVMAALAVWGGTIKSFAALAVAWPFMGVAKWRDDPKRSEYRAGAFRVVVGWVLMGVVFALTWWDQFREGLNSRIDAWSTTSTIIREHPWLGVGPGNFSREYPTFLTSAAQAKIAEPPSFLLEIAANYGLIGLAAVVATIALFFWRVIPALRTPQTEASGGRQPPEESAGDSADTRGANAPRSPRFHWEFYLGGMAGLTLGFMLRFNPTGGWQALTVEASAALIRFVIWFGAFALLERVPWTNRARVAATSMGVAALLVYLLFNPGFGMPSLAVPLWVMAALALNATPSPLWPPRHWIGLILPAPLLGVLALVFLAVVFYPAASAKSSINEARSRYPVWRDRLEPRWKEQLEKGSSANEKLKASQDADARLKKFILGPLESARDLDRGNAAICTELAYWYAKEWQFYAALKEFENKRVQYAVRERQAKAGQQALGAAAGGYQPGTGAHGAQELDPKGPEGWWVLYLIRTQFAKGTDKPKERADQFHMAANNLAKLVELDPTEPRLRLLWAEALLESRQKDDNAEAKKQLQEALRLDAEAGGGPRRLSEDDRAKLAILLGKSAN